MFRGSANCISSSWLVVYRILCLILHPCGIALRTAFQVPVVFLFPFPHLPPSAVLWLQTWGSLFRIDTSGVQEVLKAKGSDLAIKTLAKLQTMAVSRFFFP